MAYTYILRLSNNQYYVGTTVNLQHRVKEHNSGIDIFTRKHLPVTLVYFEERPEQREQRGSSLTLCRVVRGEDCSQYPTEEQAVAREKQLKGWSRAKKEALIRGDIDALRKRLC